jgi:hypothetical protein
MRYSNLIFVLCACLIQDALHAQFSFERSNHIPINFAGNGLTNPWAGGLNNAQFSNIDMDFDGRLDLFVFDRSDDQVRIFLSKNIAGQDVYLEAAEYRFNFPNDLTYRATLVDFNMDDMPDIFTYGLGGIKVYRNTGNSSIGHQWEVFVANLRSLQGGLNAILYVSSADIPSYTDVDGDGDLDILTFHIGGDRLEYHKNQSMELFGTPDSLKFELRNECWGNFRESNVDNTILLNNNLFPCGSAGGSFPNPEMVLSDEEVYALEEQRDDRHSGSTVLALDYNNSGVMDLILGDVAYPNLVKLQNGGTMPNTNSSIVAVDYFFPSNTTPASVTLFPSPFFVDANHDGIKDLVVTPNAKIVSENMNSVWRYLNTGTNAQPNFVYQESNFLQNQMIDVGSGSIPVVVDVNGDGLKDLLVANYFNFKPVLDKESRMAYYRNTGTAENPIFTFISYNQFTLNTMGLGLRIIPTFGDLDGDGDLDMLLGNETGRVHLFTNSAGAGNTMNFSTQTFNLTDEDGTTISVGTFSAPFLGDLNRDGLLDLIVGNKNGKLHYYENTGTQSVPKFKSVNPTLGGIVVDPDSPDGFAVPHFVDINGVWSLFVGTKNGNMIYATDIEGNLEPGQVFSTILPNFLNFDIQSYSSFFISDVNNNGQLELFVGNDLGGIELFENDPNSTISVDTYKNPKKLLIYPNPSENEIRFSGIDVRTDVFIYNTLGKIVLQSEISKEKLTLNLAQLPAGVYLIQVQSSTSELFTRIIKK